MSTSVTSKTAARKLTPTSIVKKLTEALMIKTGIKSGPEFTYR